MLNQKLKRIRKMITGILIKKQDKRGVAHIEIIVSFVIFVGFLIFLFATLNPIKEIRIDESIFNSIKYNIENYKDLKTEINYVSIMLDSEPSNCFMIDTSKIDELGCTASHIIVKNADGEIEDASIMSNVIMVNLVASSDNKFHTIYCSNSLTNTPIGCSGSLKEYELGIIQKEEVISVEKLKTEIFDKYENKEDYENIKQDLRIPLKNDFGLRIRDGKDIIEYEGVEFNALKNPPSAEKVLSKSYSIKILYPNADIKNVIMDILFW